MNSELSWRFMRKTNANLKMILVGYKIKRNRESSNIFKSLNFSRYDIQTYDKRMHMQL